MKLLCKLGFHDNKRVTFKSIEGYWVYTGKCTRCNKKFADYQEKPDRVQVIEAIEKQGRK